VPAAVIKNYETGTVTAVKESLASAGVGQTMHTITVQDLASVQPEFPSVQASAQLPPVQPATTRTIIKDNQGYFLGSKF
jgi:hypothetical protein